jgi:hypothetical protein
MLPIEAVFLGLDPALHKSGAGLLCPDYGGLNEKPHAFQGQYALEEFGKVLSQNERCRFVETAAERAIELGLPFVVLAETWDPPRDKKVPLVGGGFAYVKDQKWTYETILGVGEGWGRWSAELENTAEWLRDEGHPEMIVERVTPNVWRDALFGRKRPHDSEALKQYACRYFEGVFGYKASADISEAGCIALYATTSDVVRSRVEVWHKNKTTLRKKKKRVS